MPEVYLDTDVAFDIISKRSTYFETSVKLIDLFLKNKIELLLGECSLGNLFYLTRNVKDYKKATENLQVLTPMEFLNSF